MKMEAGFTQLAGALAAGLVIPVSLAAAANPPGGLFHLALTPESLSMLLGGLLALLFDWFPGLAPWFDRLSRLKKQQLMVVLLGLVAAGIFAGSCRGWFDTGLTCERASLPLLVEYILTAAAVNQAVHLLAKPAAG
ncbi:MAG TPA: hypothetical protein VGK00_02900 [Anaerolineales bacterium]